MSEPIRMALGRTPECPDLDILLQDSLPAEIQAHVKSCAHCLAELALFKEFAAAQPRADEREDLAWIESQLPQRSVAAEPPAPSPSLWDRLESWIAAPFHPGHRGALALVAAALLVVAVGGLYFRQGHVVNRPSVPDSAVWRSGQFTAIAPAGEVTEAPREFRWEPVPEAASYQLKLMEVDRTVIWSVDSTQPSVEIPNNIRAQFRQARAFIWQVTARGRSGEILGTTDLQSFHIPVTTR